MLTSAKQPAVLSLSDVQSYLSISRSLIYLKLDEQSKYYDSAFPRPIKLGSRRLGFKRVELDQWLDQLAA
jgi:prophage regulatory protein